MRRVMFLCAGTLAASALLIYISCSGSAPPTVLEPAAAEGPGWTELLRRYGDDVGWVDYARWKQDGTAELDGLLARMGRIDADALTRPQALAHWINLYNALTIRAIKVSPLGYNVWKDYRLMVDGRQVSLDQIENEILRSIKEPRIHFAINCASIGCPKLRREAYEADRIEEQLEDQARAFFADPRNFEVDVDTRTARVSSILKWFAGDFGDVREFISRYVDPQAGRYLVTRGMGLRYKPYDWSLNERR